MGTQREWWSWTVMAGTAAAVLSMFTAWVTIVAFGQVTLSGIDIDDGKVAAVLFTIGVVSVWPTFQGQRLSRVRWVAAVVFGALASLVALYYVSGAAFEDAPLGRAGGGAWLMLIAGGALIAGAIGARERPAGDAQPF